jgi:hypothetical protein
LKIEKNVTISGHAAADTTIRGSGSSRVMEILGKPEVELKRVTISNGVASAPEPVGAGIFAITASLVLQEVAVTKNLADADGGTGATGAGVFMASGSLEVLNSNVSENTARANANSGEAGGGAVAGGVYAVGLMRIVDSTISGNIAESHGGQGPSDPAQDGGSVTAGGVYATQVFPGSSKIIGSTISDNTVDTMAGPGGEPGSAVAGGIYEVAGYPVTIAGSTIAGNFARTHSGNGSAVAGGGYLIAGEPGVLTVFGTTIDGNGVEGSILTSVGGNLYTSQGSFRDSIVANGSGGIAAYENCFASSAVSYGFNLDSRDQCEFHAAGDKINTDPQLGPLQNNGGPTATMLPAVTSPVVDQGIALRPEDQRGVARPIDFPSIANAPGGDGGDIGAVELAPVSSLSLAKPKLEKKKGRAKLTATIPVPSAGAVTLAGKGLKKQTVALTGQGSVVLKVIPTGGVAKALRKKGAAKVKYEVTYSPTANAPVVKSASVKLVKKAKKAKKKAR